MGMFDRIYDADGQEWQTKAYDRLLRNYRLRDQVPALVGREDYQVLVLGDHDKGLATVRGGILTAVPDDRDPELALMTYFGLLDEPATTAPAAPDTR